MESKWATAILLVGVVVAAVVVVVVLTFARGRRGRAQRGNPLDQPYEQGLGRDQA